MLKLDAHCAVGKGFDRILIENMQDDWTVFPYQYNLHAFDWKCKKCGHTRYQGPSGPCDKVINEKTKRSEERSVGKECLSVCRSQIGRAHV